MMSEPSQLKIQKISEMSFKKNDPISNKLSVAKIKPSKSSPNFSIGQNNKSLKSSKKTLKA